MEPSVKADLVNALASAELSESVVAADEPVNILIVDDEPANLTVLETVLQDSTYRLVRAQSADQALLALINEEFALIILDINMPGMSGFELAQMIKQRKKTADIPIIFLTAYYSEDQHVLEGYGTGAVDYLHKPISAPILRSKVAVFADLYRKTRECALANTSLLSEVAERRRIQEQLLLLNDELEQRVEQRTAELLRADAALRHSEERLRLANEASGTGLWEWNLQTDKVVWSAECYEIQGLAPESFERTGTAFFDLIHPDDRQKVQERTDETIARRTPYACDFRILRPDGTQRWVSTKGRAFFDAEDRPLRMIGTIIDITSRKEAEELLRAADRQKDEFLATLAHELRNPLAPIRNAVQILLRKGPDVPDLVWARDVIDRQVTQMTRLVDDLLDVSRITTGKLDLRLEPTDLADVVKAAVETSQPIIEQHGHRLAISLSDRPLIVKADVIRLAQVFANLLNNAAKYTERGGEIELRIEQQENRAVATVKDSGIGIAADMLTQVFSLFTQVDRHLDRSQGGLGIGLTLVKRLVEMHGGTVEAHSAGVGLGSYFVVQLPIVAKVEPNNAPSRDSKPVSAAANFRIIVVDDNQDGAKSLGMMLAMLGNEVRIANDGFAAIKEAEEFRPNVMLLDIGMPQMDGYEVCRRIRNEPWGQAMTLIALTGWGQDEDRKRTAEAGFDHHLVKPVPAQVLIDVIARLGRGRDLDVDAALEHRPVAGHAAP